MARVIYDNTYSRVIAWLKILLPLAALAIMSTVFLVARTIDPAQNLPYADVDASTLAREQRVGQPSYSGVTEDGAAVRFNARVIRPRVGDSETSTGSQLNAEIDLPVGTKILINAADGVIDDATSTAELGGGVELTTSNGYVMQTDRMASKLDRTQMESGGPVSGSAPVGTLDAGHMTLTRDAQTDQYLLVFNKGVKLVYDPVK